MFQELSSQKIHVGFSPYTYVRVMAMKGKLYRKQDYDKLLKMQGNEIAAYLEASDYKQDIHALGKEYSGYSLVEHALSLNLVRSLQKLQQMSSPDMRHLLQAYSYRHDIYNLKTILRAKATGKDFPEIRSLFVPIGLFTEQKLSLLFAGDSLSSILKKAGFSEREFHTALQYYESEKSLFELENFLDKQYYSFLFLFLSRLSAEHQLFKEFLQSELDVLNIKLLLRLKKQSFDENRTAGFFFAAGTLFSLAKLRHLAKQDFSSIITFLQTTPFKVLVQQHREELAEKKLHGFEKTLDVWLLQRATLLLHQFPLSVDTLLGYMFAKEIEARNLRVLVKGKQLGLAEEFLATQLVIG